MSRSKVPARLRSVDAYATEDGISQRPAAVKPPASLTAGRGSCAAFRRGVIARKPKLGGFRPPDRRLFPRQLNRGAAWRRRLVGCLAHRFRIVGAMHHRKAQHAAVGVEVSDVINNAHRTPHRFERERGPSEAGLMSPAPADLLNSPPMRSTLHNFRNRGNLFGRRRCRERLNGGGELESIWTRT